MGLRERLVAAAITACAVGCAADEPPSAAPEPVLLAGPSPLRRLSNEEYLHALADLFPGAHATLAQAGLPALPHDTVVAGFENAADVQEPSDVRIARYEAIAGLYAAETTRDAAAVRALVGCDWATPSAANACGARFLDEAGRRLYRRPLETAEKDRLGKSFASWATSIDFEAAVRLTLASMLQAPAFLYRIEPDTEEREETAADATARASRSEPVPPYPMASRLSFFLWQSVPDDALLEAASRDELRTEAQLREQVRRMLEDPRARRLYWSFHRQWLGLERILDDEHGVRTFEVDPMWTTATPRSAVEESRRFVEGTLAEGGSFQDLLTSRRAVVDAETARLYGVAPPAPGARVAQVELDGRERAGLLTRIAFLAAYSHRGATSPPLRGNGVLLRLLCKMPQEPPPDADLSQPKAAPGAGPQTNRTLFEERTRPASCQGCHVALNGLGFGFESYSASGAFQAYDHGLPVDARGEVHGVDVNGPFDGAIALSERLARSRSVRSCATRQWVRYALGRAPTGSEAAMVERLTDRFMEGQGSMTTLLEEIVVSAPFRLRRRRP